MMDLVITSSVYKFAFSGLLRVQRSISNGEILNIRAIWIAFVTFERTFCKIFLQNEQSIEKIWEV